MKSKTQLIREALAGGDQIGALRIAGFFDRSLDTKIFKRGLNAHNHPDFYRHLGEQPDKIIALALNVLVERFGSYGR